MLPTLRRSTRERRLPNRYGFNQNIKNETDGLNVIIEAIEMLESNGFKVEDPIDKFVNHYDNIGLSVKKTGTNSLKFIYNDSENDFMDDNQFKLALLNASGDHQKWIEIVEKGLQQWKKNFIDLTN